MKETEYRRLREKIEKEYHDGIASLERIWRLSNPNDALPKDGEKPAKKGELVRLVKDAVLALQGEFTIHDLEATIQNQNPTVEIKRASLSSTLKRMEGTEIEVVATGSGKRPSTYRRIETAAGIRAVN